MAAYCALIPLALIDAFALGVGAFRALRRRRERNIYGSM